MSDLESEDMVPRTAFREAKKRIEFLEAELAKYKWHQIDHDDPGTWPEKRLVGGVYEGKTDDGQVIPVAFDLKGRPYISYFYPDECEDCQVHDNNFDYIKITHYRRIIGPEDD